MRPYRARNGSSRRSWKVGELARATGLTIRALHHYDEIGLLVPTRTESGHSVYGPDDVERLYRVVALRGIGLPLDEIAAVLDEEQVSLVDTVRRHVASVEREIDRRRRLLERLLEMLAELERSARVGRHADRDGRGDERGRRDGRGDSHA